jgi:alkanesulfonate monooxygenase
VLKRHCEAVGRPYDEIERTALGRVSGATKAADLIATCRALAEVGIQHFIFSIENVHDITPVERIGREVIPAVAEFE